MLLAQVVLPFFLGLLAGQLLSSRSPGSPWAHLLYGVGCVGAIWLFIPNPLELPPVVTFPGLILGGVLSGLFDVRRVINQKS